MKRWHLIAGIAAIALTVALTVGIMSAIQTSRPSTKEVQLQAELAVWKDRAKGAFYQSAKYRIKARKKDKTISALQAQLKTNQIQTNEEVSSIDMLHADSLARYVSKQLDFLHTAW